MSVKILIPTPMRQHTDGKATVEVDGATAKECLDALCAKYSAITARLFDNGQLRRFINVFLNDEDVRYLDNLATPTKDGDKLDIIPAVAGG